MTMTGRQACSIDEYVNGEKSLPTCREMDGTQDEEKDDDNNEIVEPIKIKLTRKLMNIYKMYSTFLKAEGMQQKFLK